MGLKPSLAQIKGHPSLVPLYMIMGAGVTWAFYNIKRGINSPDVRFVNKDGDSVANAKAAWDKATRHQIFDPKAGTYEKMKPPAERPNIEKIWEDYKRKND